MSYDHEPPPPGPTEPAPVDVGPMSFEQALEELEGIVQSLERGRLDLDAAIAAYERGSALRRHCDDKLKAAELRVQQIAAAPGGGVSLRDAPAEADGAPF